MCCDGFLQENVPGEFPSTAGLYSFKRVGEDPIRVFAKEGGPERTNKRFHYVIMGLPAKRHLPPSIVLHSMGTIHILDRIFTERLEMQGLASVVWTMPKNSISGLIWQIQ